MSVFKEADVDISGNYLDHFKRNGKCLKTQSEKCPRQPSTWLGRMDEARSAVCREGKGAGGGTSEGALWGGGPSLENRDQPQGVVTLQPPAPDSKMERACLCFSRCPLDPEDGDFEAFLLAQAAL